jgi:hypothetical protein
MDDVELGVRYVAGHVVWGQRQMRAWATDVRLDPTLVTMAFDWARTNVVRRPGFFGPELAPPADASEQTRMLAYLGRAAWQPVTS